MKKLYSPFFLRTAFVVLLMLTFVRGWGQNIIITQSSSGIAATGYDSGAERTWVQNSVSFGAKAVFKELNQSRLQFQATNGVLYNTTPLPGKIISISINQTNSNTFTLSGGNTTRLVNSTTGNYNVSGGTAVGGASSTGWNAATLAGTDYTYFAIKKGSGASYITDITITYESAPTCTPPATPTGAISGTTPACTSTTLTYTLGSGEATSGFSYYWQTTANGTSTANNASSTFTTTSANNYVRAYNSATTCWSAATANYPVVINSTIATLATAPSPTNASTGVCYSGSGAINSISWTAAAGATSYDVYFDAGSLPGTLTSNVTGTSYSVGTLLPSTTYYWRIVPRNGCGITTGTPVTWSFTTAAGICYCTPTFSNASDFIVNFGLESITNNTSGFSAGGYGNFTSLSTNLIENSSYSASLTSSAGTGNHGVAIWIDFNNNGTFETSERVGSLPNNVGANTTVSIPITIPLGNIGSHRMRVIYQYNVAGTAIDPCISGSYGEAEDYTVNIVAASANPVLAISGTPTNHGTACPTIAATPITYTITNTGLASANDITVVSSDPQFVVSGLSSTTIAGSGGTATYTVTFTPSSAGAKTATITVATTTAGSNSPTSSLTGTGNTAVVATVTTGAVSLNTTGTTATLNASAATFGVCPTTTVKGFVISKTSDNAAPTVGGANVTNETVTPLGGNGAYVKAITSLTINTSYSYRAYLYDGTTYTYGDVVTFVTPLVSSANDHFRTSKSGNWSDTISASTPWESSADGVNGWHISTLAPGTNASSVDILSGHHIVINTTGIVITKTQVFGSLEARGSNFSVNGIAEEIELTIKDGGSFITNGNGFENGGNAYGLVETGGKLISFTGSGGDFAKNYLESTAGLFYFGNNSICEWQNTGSTLGSGYSSYFNTFYAIDGLPIFRIVNQPADPFGGALSNVFNAKLEANANFSIRNGGTKTFIGGVIGTATVSQQATSGNLILGNGTNIPEIGGAVTLDVVAAKLKLPNGALVPAASNVIIKSSAQNNTFDREGGNLTIDGILDITNMRITNTATGGVIVNGTLKTANTGGLYGTDSAILSGNLTINDNSTVEYYATANQTISSVPTYYNVIFSGASVKSPVTDLTVNNIATITAGTLQINETADNVQPHVFTAKKGLQNTGGTVLLANNANLLQDVDAANVGNVTMERKATVPSTQYNYWASPVKNQPLYGLYGALDMPDKTVKTYNTATDFFTNLPKISNPKSVFGKGYSIKGPTNSTIAPYPITATFVGEPNNESTTPSENTTPLSTVGARYNLIGNPYPSNLNLVELYNANVGQFHIDGADTPTAYLWDNTGNTHLIQQGSEYANYATNNYATVNLSSGIGTSATSPTASVKKPNGIVRPGQGFIIKASAGATGLTFKNEDMRTSSIEMGGSNSEYFKNTSAPSNDNFWLTLTTPSNMNIVIAMSYNPNAENTFERFDSKIPNEAVTENFYSLSSDAKKLAIQSRKDFTTSDVVPLGIKSSKTEIQKISIDEKYGVFENQNIYLKDNLLNIVTNLSQGAYEFTAPIGINENRFEIVFEPSATLGTGATTKESLQVYRNGESFVVKSGQSKIDEVEVFDASGRLFQKVKGGSTEVKLDATVLPAGMYILKISRSNETISKKIIK